MRSVAIILGCAAFPGGFSEGVRRRLGEGECALSAAQLLTLPMDLLFCFSQSQGLDASTCIADRAYTLSTGCETCLFKAYGDACDCTDNPFSPACQLCSQTRATAALTSCVPEWDPRTQIPTSDEEQCSIADVATVASPAQFRALVDCLQAGRSTMSRNRSRGDRAHMHRYVFARDGRRCSGSLSRRRGSATVSGLFDCRLGAVHASSGGDGPLAVSRGPPGDRRCVRGELATPRSEWILPVVSGGLPGAVQRRLVWQHLCGEPRHA